MFKNTQNVTEEHIIQHNTTENFLTLYTPSTCFHSKLIDTIFSNCYLLENMFP